MKKLIALLLTLTAIFCCLTACSEEPEAKAGTVNIAVEMNHDAVIAKMVSGEISIAILPEPKATVSINQAKKAGQNYSIKLNLSQEWDKVSDNSLPMGCIIVKNSVLQNNEAAVKSFLSEYKSSVEYIGNQANIESAAAMIVSAGILPNAVIAKSALSNLNGSIVYKDGEDMRNTLEAFYTAIGIQKPNAEFYYSPSENSGESAALKIGVMNGPTGMGMAKLIDTYGSESEKYVFKSYSAPTDALAPLSNGEIDMLCVPTNLAANLANKSSDYISVAAINCLGSLYVVAKEGVNIESVNDLIDQTVYYGEKTSTTEPIFKYILQKNNIEANVLDETVSIFDYAVVAKRDDEATYE